MTTLNNFKEYYKSISNTELLSILENPHQYQSLAVEAAKKEFSNRQLSDTEISEAKKPLIEKQLHTEKQKDKINAIEHKAKKILCTLLDTFNPIQSGIQSTEKIIRFIVIVFGGFSLYQIINDFKFHLASLMDFPRYPIEIILYFFPIVILPVATVTFWKRKSTGWVLLTIFMTFSVFSLFWLLILSFLWSPSGNSVLDNIISYPPPFKIFISLLFFTGTLFVICKQNIRNIFLISENKMVAIISLTAVFSFFLLYASL
jgi:hypothetical protein